MITTGDQDDDDKIYRDQQIIVRASQLQNFTPPKIAEMRRLAPNHYSQSDPRIFCKQAKFMEDYEDSFNYSGEFMSYYPTYQAMRNDQLRGYFSWRTQLRMGNLNRTSLSFAFVYIYELLNQIGAPTPEACFEKLKAFCRDYSELDYRIDNYAKRWLRDYAVYYGLDCPVPEGSGAKEDYEALVTALCYTEHSQSELLTALDKLSSYKLGSSRFGVKYRGDVEQVVYNVYNALTEHCDKKRKKPLKERLFGRVVSGQYIMFNSAVVYEQKRHEDCEYKINELCSYRCKNGLWYSERFMIYSERSKQLGLLLKAIDYEMRMKYDFRYTLKPVKTTKLLSEIIIHAIDELLEEKERRARPQIDIDLSKLQDIRSSSLKTQSSLLVYVEPEENEDELFSMPESDFAKTEIIQNEPFDELSPSNPLDETEREFLRALLDGRQYDKLLREKGLMASLVVDSINEKLLDSIGDTALEWDGDTPKPVEDYIEELKELSKIEGS